MARFVDFDPLSHLRERVGAKAGGKREAQEEGPHPALRATFSRKREKRRFASLSTTRATRRIPMLTAAAPPTPDAKLPALTPPFRAAQVH
jgi:hypothetical protein